MMKKSAFGVSLAAKTTPLLQFQFVGHSMEFAMITQ